ncbi:Protein F25D1.2 [Aphelenchoides avenae]|nr:Protein F25D1.2 [Aphelenchus avenae]
MLQLTVLFFMKSMAPSVSRRVMLFGGYGICLAAFGFLLITQFVSTLDEQPAFRAGASAFWFTTLAVANSIPCNTGVCLISELHDDRTSLIKATAMSRSFFWILAAVTSASFLPILDRGSFFWSVLPYFIVSLALYTFLVFRQSVMVKMTAVGMRKKSYEILSHSNEHLHFS